MKIEDLKENLQISFVEEVEETYVVSVDIGMETFEVNCQFGTTRSYRQSSKLRVYNESGGDIGDSGLSKYLEENGFEFDTDGYNFVVEKIEECANEQLPENSVLRILNASGDEEFKLEKTLFGSFGPTDVMHAKYSGSNGKIIVTSEDTSAPRAENQLLGYKRFSGDEEYSEWMDSIYQDGHYGDCSVSYRAWEDIVDEEERNA